MGVSKPYCAVNDVDPTWSQEIISLGDVLIFLQNMTAGGPLWYPGVPFIFDAVPCGSLRL